jgi:hypothetical protein
MNRYLLCILIGTTGLLKAQDIKNAPFRVDAVQKILLAELNRFRASKGLDSLEKTELLVSAADMSAQDMADEGSEKTDENTSVKYLEAVGATKQGRELTMKATTSKGRDSYTSGEVAKVIYNRWENNEKNLAVLLNPKYTLCGIAGAVDEEGETVFISAFFGGYDISNEGVQHKKQLTVPYNTASKSLKDGNPRACKTCEQWRNYDLLQKGLYVKDNKIYLRYPNSRDMRRFLRKPKDGIAVDVVQRSQYLSAFYNIVNNNLLNKGVMSKVIYKDQIFKKNLLITKDKKANRKVKGIEIEIGKFNPKITGPYELNLLIIQDGKLCKTVTRGYVETENVESSTPIGLLPIDDPSGKKQPFDPKSESSILNFIIPFQKNKAEFQDSDIQPFLKALNEPDFIVEGLYIYAYSSIEGDSVANSKLQQKRAESVVNVLQRMQKDKISTTILNRDSWGLFLLENEDGKFADVVNLGKQKAINRINSDKKLLEDLEPILAKERFAQIIMDVTYDLSGDKEKNFATVSFNRAARSGNSTLANNVLQFITKRIKDGKYPTTVLDSLAIPLNEKNITVLNNHIYSKYQTNNSLDDDDAQTLQAIAKLQPNNAVLQYNMIFSKLKTDTNAGNSAHQAEMQQMIDQLYGKLDSNFVNGLNIEWQFRIMESADTLPDAETRIDACINRIKSFYNLKEATWQNAVKLAQIFARAKDYRNASAVLEPYLLQPKVGEQLIFLYISTASRLREKYYSRIFAKALDLAREKNPERYCKLFGEPFITFQVLENPAVKRSYQLSCGK